MQQVKWMDQPEKDWLAGELKKDLEEYGQTRHGNPLHALKDKRACWRWRWRCFICQ